MKLTKTLAALTAAVSMTVLGSSAVGGNPWQTVEIEFGAPAEYVSCLDDAVSSYYWVTIRYREFETPSGASHYYMEHWTWEAEYIGEWTGRVWFGYGGSPGGTHARKGEVSQWTSHELARPVVGDGPKIRYNQRFKYTVNANGELKVWVEPPVALDDWIRCLGPKG